MIFDLIAQQSVAVSTWTPADLFQNGEIGAWYDASDLSTLFQDSTGTTPVTASGQPVGLWKNKIVGQARNFDLRQATSSKRPALNITSGKYAINFDGVDDQLASPSYSSFSTTGATGAVGQINGNTTTGYGLSVSNELSIETTTGSKSYSGILGGNATSSNTFTTGAPNTMVAYGQPNVTNTTIKMNGVTTTGTLSSGSSTITAGTVSLPRTTTTSPKSSQVVFINRVLTAGEISLLEAFIASKQ